MKNPTVQNPVVMENVRLDRAQFISAYLRQWAGTSYVWGGSHGLALASHMKIGGPADCSSFMSKFFGDVTGRHVSVEVGHSITQDNCWNLPELINPTFQDLKKAGLVICGWHNQKAAGTHGGGHVLGLFVDTDGLLKRFEMGGNRSGFHITAVERGGEAAFLRYVHSRPNFRFRGVPGFGSEKYFSTKSNSSPLNSEALPKGFEYSWKEISSRIQQPLKFLAKTVGLSIFDLYQGTLSPAPTEPPLTDAQMRQMDGFEDGNNSSKSTLAKNQKENKSQSNESLETKNSKAVEICGNISSESDDTLVSANKDITKECLESLGSRKADLIKQEREKNRREHSYSFFSRPTKSFFSAYFKRFSEC